MYIAGTFYEDVDYILAKEPHELARKYLLQDVYKTFVTFRTILGGQKCKKMRLSEMKERLKDPENVAKIIETLPKYDEKTIKKVLEIAENHIPMIK